MKTQRQLGTAIELALWLAVFAAIFSQGSADANLLIAIPVVLSLIALRIVSAVIAGAFAAVWRELLGR